MIGRRAEAAALLRAVLEDPADDAVRLVYSDWLEEHGQPLRAEFIRVQIQVAELRLGLATGASEEELAKDSFYQALRQRERKLLGSVLAEGVTCNGYRWSEPLHDLEIQVGYFRHEDFRRGFLAAVGLRRDHLLTHAAELFASHPFTEVRLSDCSPATPALGRPYWRCGSTFLPHDIPSPVFRYLANADPERIDPFVRYPSQELALADLSRACVLFGREQAGLPPLSDRR